MSLTNEQLTDLLKRHKHKGDLTSILIDYLIKTSPDYTQGDIFYIDGDKTIQRLAAGTSGQYLKTQGGSANPIWATISAVSALDDLSDVVITTPAVGSILYYDGANWIDSLFALNDLNDVIITSPATGQVLEYNGSAWAETLTPRIAAIKKTNFNIQNDSAVIVAYFVGTQTTGNPNYILFDNAASGNPPTIRPESAGDTNIDLLIKGDGTGKVRIGNASLKFPNSDGNADEVLQTDGAAILSFGPAPIAKRSAVQAQGGGSDFFVLRTPLEDLTSNGTWTTNDFRKYCTDQASPRIATDVAEADSSKDFVFEVVFSATATDYVSFSGVADFNAPGNSTTEIRNHAGFLIDYTASPDKLYASVGNGTAQTISSAITATISNHNIYRVERIGSSVYFYLNGTLVATLATNLPTDTTCYVVPFGLNNATNTNSIEVKQGWGYAQSL